MKPWIRNVGHVAAIIALVWCIAFPVEHDRFSVEASPLRKVQLVIFGLLIVYYIGVRKWLIDRQNKKAGNFDHE